MKMIGNVCAELSFLTLGSAMGSQSICQNDGQNKTAF